VNSTDSYERTTYLTYEVVGEVGGKVTVTTRVAISADYMRLTATKPSRTHKDRWSKRSSAQANNRPSIDLKMASAVPWGGYLCHVVS
jgi:hypothetical protein